MIERTVERTVFSLVVRASNKTLEVFESRQSAEHAQFHSVYVPEQLIVIRGVQFVAKKG